TMVSASGTTRKTATNRKGRLNSQRLPVRLQSRFLGFTRPRSRGLESRPLRFVKLHLGRPAVLPGAALLELAADIISDLSDFLGIGGRKLGRIGLGIVRRLWIRHVSAETGDFRAVPASKH